MGTYGFIKISRSILDLNVWNNPYDSQLFFYCLLKATYKPFGSLRPGQLFYSVQTIAKRLQWSRNSVSKHIRALSDAGVIQIDSTEAGSVMTIVNWNEICGQTYQNAEPEAAYDGAQDMCMSAQIMSMPAQQIGMAAQEMSEDAQMMSGDAQMMGMNAQQISAPCTPFEHKQEIKKRKEIPITYSERERDFLQWWSMYPRHDGRSEALSLWMNELRDVSTQLLMQALNTAKCSTDWQKENGRYVPSAAKWLDGRWEDYLPKQRNEVRSTWTEY